VWAAYKKEQAKGLQGRASRAVRDIDALFDVNVAGDGEKAIFDAIQRQFTRMDRR
jgi:hypothetical protein